tara:strand:- start:117 stop:377 length:261 start_codon:yes stop_codon:yes gene_type:complete
MNTIEFYFQENLDNYINQERLDLIMIYLAFEQKVVLNIDYRNSAEFNKEAQESKLADYLSDKNISIYLRERTVSQHESKIVIRCAN